jgi:mediator of RNA polymerase II transcription subunit 16
MRKMPMIMEDEMNVDHLFNDDSLLMIPSRPPSKELYQRLDELRGSGCCQ